MTKKSNWVLVSLITMTYFLILFISQKLLDFNSEQKDPSEFHFNGSISSISQTMLKITIEFEKEMENYQFPLNKTLKDFLITSGGKPLRNIIVSTWRTGCSFLGDILDIVPGTWYHFEPLMDFGVTQIRNMSDEDDILALMRLKNMLNCKYHEMEDYREYLRLNNAILSPNTRLWRHCLVNPLFCINPVFLEKNCQLYPFQIMKVLRIRLQLIEELLKDEELDVRVLYFVRDPRGIMLSRKTIQWCQGAVECDQPLILCRDLMSDYETAVRFSKLYPDKFR